MMMSSTERTKSKSTTMTKRMMTRMRIWRMRSSKAAIGVMKRL
jgi:hypothetical protein